MNVSQPRTSKKSSLTDGISVSDAFDAANQSLQEAHQKAQKNTDGVIERYYSIAGQLIRLCFAGPAMLSSVRALEHARCENTGQPNLTIHVWESSSSGARIPDVPWIQDYASGSGTILSVRKDEHCMAYHCNTGVLSLLDIAGATGYYWVEKSDGIPYYEVARPMSLLLHWWFHQHGYQILHGAALGLDGKGIVLAGKAGSGKSTTSLLWLEAGYQYLGDDYCLVGRQPELTIYSLYNSAMLFPDDVQQYPSLQPFVAEPLNPTDEKRIIYITDKKRLIRSLACKAIVFPRVSQQERAALSLLSPAEAMKALAPSTLFQLPGASESAFRMMASLVKQTPCYRLELGRDRQHAVEVIREFLQSS